tara:strand:- start:554 stop:1084 length:531 start_codon:yes stop_codon:yes gene_type:complete
MSKRLRGRGVLKTLYELHDQLGEIVESAVEENIAAGKAIEAAWGEIIKSRASGLGDIESLRQKLFQLQQRVSRRLAGVSKEKAGDISDTASVVARARALISSGLPPLSVDPNEFLSSIAESLSVDSDDGEEFEIEVGDEPDEGDVEIEISIDPDDELLVVDDSPTVATPPLPADDI